MIFCLLLHDLFCCLLEFVCCFMIFVYCFMIYFAAFLNLFAVVYCFMIYFAAFMFTMEENKKIGMLTTLIWLTNTMILLRAFMSLGGENLSILHTDGMLNISYRVE
nr:uncharacterized protein LOC112790553 isoform X4 [Arachis hypogaea]